MRTDSPFCASSLSQQSERRKKLHIDDFGINYDGDSNILRNVQLQRSAYGLLAYTVKPEGFRALVQGR